MKIFNIPAWDTDSGLTHYATTWVLLSDIDNDTEVYRVDESTESLLGLEVNIVPLVGEVYYIKALRHLKDADDNIVEYDKWIGPTKLINDLSNQSDVLISNTYIDTPYLIDISIDAVDGLSLSLANYNGNVPLLATQVIIESITGMEVYTKRYDSTITDIVIPNTIYNFTIVESFIIKVIHIGDFNTISPTLKEKHSYVSNIYTVIGNLNLIDPATETTIKLLPIDDTYLAIDAATVKTIDGNIAVACEVINNSMVISSNDLDYNTTYVLTLDLTYIDPNSSETITVTKRHYLSTKNENEQVVFNKNIVYLDELTLIKQANPLTMDNVILNTEQSLYGVIPFITNGNITLYTHDEDTDTFNILKDTGITLPNNYFKMEFLPNNKLLVFYTEDNITTNVNIYNYDYYTDNVTLVNSVSNISRYTNLLTNSFTLINNRYYFYDYNDTEDITTLVIKYVNLIDNLVYDYKEIQLLDLTTFTDCNVTLINVDDILIVPKTEDSIYSYIYNFTYDNVIQGPTIPLDFRNINLVSKRLINGDVLYTMFDTGDNKEYAKFNHITSTFDVNTFDTDTTHYLNMSIGLKSGVYDILIYEDTDSLDIYRYQ